MRLDKVFGEGLVHAWPALERMLLEQPSLWASLGNLEQIHEAVFDGQLQLWVLVDEDDNQVKMAALTQLVFYLEGVALRIVWAKGKDIKEGIPNILDLEHVAKKVGCKWVEFLGREGWQRWFRDYGYKTEFMLLRKELDNGQSVDHYKH